MAVDANTYGTVAKIQARVGDISDESRAFTATTTPTVTEVEGFLDEIAAELNVRLNNSGYTVPVAVGDDAIPHAYLVYANVMGASVLVLDSLPSEASSTIEAEGVPQGRKQHFQQAYLAALKLIDDEKLGATRASGGSRLGDLTIGSSTDSDGNVTKPFFTRAMTDYPSSRSLTK